MDQWNIIMISSPWFVAITGLLVWGVKHTKQTKKSSILADSRGTRSSCSSGSSCAKCAAHCTCGVSWISALDSDGGMVAALEHDILGDLKQLRKTLNGFLQLVLWNWRTWGDFLWQVGNYDQWYARELKLQVNTSEIKRVTKYIYIICIILHV